MAKTRVFCLLSYCLYSYCLHNFFIHINSLSISATHFSVPVWCFLMIHHWFRVILTNNATSFPLNFQWCSPRFKQKFNWKVSELWYITSVNIIKMFSNSLHMISYSSLYELLISRISLHVAVTIWQIKLQDMATHCWY